MTEQFAMPIELCEDFIATACSQVLVPRFGALRYTSRSFTRSQCQRCSLCQAKITCSGSGTKRSSSARIDAKPRYTHRLIFPGLLWRISHFANPLAVGCRVNWNHFRALTEELA